MDKINYLKFMKLAILESNKSIDPSRKVGSILVGSDGHIYGKGYNNFPKWFNTNNLTKLTKHEKSTIITHAEVSCLNNSIYYPNNMTMFITSVPCLNCVMSIVNSNLNITTIVYKYNELSNGYYERHKINESLQYLKNNGIKIVEFNYEQTNIAENDFKELAVSEINRKLDIFTEALKAWEYTTLEQDIFSINSIITLKEIKKSMLS